MLLAALLDAGAPLQQVLTGLESIPLGGGGRGGGGGDGVRRQEWGLRTERVVRSEGHIAALKVGRICFRSREQVLKNEWKIAPLHGRLPPLSTIQRHAFILLCEPHPNLQPIWTTFMFD